MFDSDIPPGALDAVEGFFELGDPAEALRVLDALPVELRAAARTQLLRSLVLMSLGRWPEAELAAMAALGLATRSPLAWYSLAVAQAQQEKIDAARLSLESAFALDAELREIARRDPARASLW
jgi:tetratricopeptide (TPR) repeat protein